MKTKQISLRKTMVMLVLTVILAGVMSTRQDGHNSEAMPSANGVSSGVSGQGMTR